MNIQDAIKSGKPFKRPHNISYKVIEGDNLVNISTNLPIDKIPFCDVLAEDWELKQEPRKVTLYQYLYKESAEYFMTEFTSLEWEARSSFNKERELLKTFTREIEF